MTTGGQVFLELLPIEINQPRLKQVFQSQFKKGITLAHILPAIEKEHVEKIKESVSRILKNEIGDLEAEYLKTNKAIQELLISLQYLFEARKHPQSIEILPENESEALQKIQSELKALEGQLDPAVQSILRKREHEYSQLGRVYQETVDRMEEETINRSKKIILEYEDLGQEKFDLILKTFAQFFSNLRGQSEKLISFIQLRISDWNTQVLKTGRGLYIKRTDGLPCSILFSVKGQCHLIFENVGQLLGSGLDKLVLRSFSIPQGKIEALIKPLFVDVKKDDPEFEKLQNTSNQRFHDIWIETEMLMKLKEKRGIVSLQERMAFQIDQETTLFLVEDFYWDGNLWNYMKYPIYLNIESSRFTPEIQKAILTDLLTGLNEIHRQGIVHHDIKLDNILLDLEKKESKAVIADFQLATYLNDKNRIGYLRFIPKWIPPEFAKIHLDPDRPEEVLNEEYIAATTDKMDVWCLGIVFYCLIAYELPFWVKIEKEEKDEPEDLQALFHLISHLEKGWLPEALKSSPYFFLLEKMLDPDPKDRCTAEEALTILEKIQI